ncbi:MAG: thymidine phosphorylase [Candidatus Palauibacterales bacterium]|nr:thymidine phosphorylase [Candidatus Palauibacterales bacterium]
MTLPTEVIEAKRDGSSLPVDVLRDFLAAYGSGEVADYQMAAFLMAVYFRGLDDGELRTLTRAILASGVQLDWTDGPAVVDKHSTGGVGDTVSLVLAPLLAEAGFRVPMISGRGLGHTGGTLDKLESIPGFRTDLDLDELRSAVRDLGCGLAGQTDDLAPLDGRLYALRDVTGTVPSVPLIASSIISKKAAEGLDALVLDVKVGRGGFMETMEEARRLARTLVELGTELGLRCRALLTDMRSPLGPAVGNALEAREAIRCLRGGVRSDLVDVTLALGGELAAAADPSTSAAAARDELEELLDSGAAAGRMARIVERQGGDPRVMDEPDRLPSAPVRRAVTAEDSGTVSGIDAREVGLAAVELGAGRRTMGEEVDPAVGFRIHVRPGDRVEPGDELAEVHARSEEDATRAETRFFNALSLGEGGAVEGREGRVLERVPVD